MRQELTESRWPGRRSVLVVAALALPFAYATTGSEASLLLRYATWTLIGVALLYGARLAGAQLRRHAQPYDHTLVLSEDGVALRDNLCQRDSQHAWRSVQRERITPAAFEFSLRDREASPVYLVDRAKLSDAEEAWLAGQLLAL